MKKKIMKKKIMNIYYAAIVKAASLPMWLLGILGNKFFGMCIGFLIGFGIGDVILNEKSLWILFILLLSILILIGGYAVFNGAYYINKYEDK